MSAARATLIWTALVLAILAPIAAAATSPLLAWRQPVYIAAGFAGIDAVLTVSVSTAPAAGSFRV